MGPLQKYLLGVAATITRGTSEVRIGTNCARLMSPDLVILFLSTTYANEVQNQKESGKRPEESQENCQFKQKLTQIEVSNSGI